MAMLGNDHSEEEFDTERILYAVGDLDEIRSILGDREEEESGCIIKPPEIRENLMKLHRLVFNDGFKVPREDMCKAADILEEIDGDLYEIMRYAEKIESVLEDLRKVMPEFDKSEDTGT